MSTMRAPIGVSTTDIEKYDRAVASYLVGLTEKLIYSPTSKARREISKLKTDDDKIPWAFMSYYRHPQFEIDTERDGFPNRMIGDNTGNVLRKGIVNSTRVKALPINLTYSVDIWSGTHRRVLEIATLTAERLFFNERVLTAPVDVEDEDARFAILNLDWTDNSDIENEEEIGRIYRHTFTFSIDAVFKVISTTRTYPLDMSKLLIEIYEGEDINAEVCKKCDFDRLHPEG